MGGRMGACKVDAAFDSRDRALLGAPFELDLGNDLGNENKEIWVSMLKKSRKKNWPMRREVDSLSEGPARMYPGGVVISSFGSR